VDVLQEMEAESVQCVVTSPPYWGLRRYDGQQEAVWGGDPDCEHEWTSRRYYAEQSLARDSREAFSEAGEGNAARLKAARWREDSACAKCGAWRGPFGLQPTPEMYVEHTVYVLREIRRVLRPDGVVWWNLGDTFFGSWGNYGSRRGRQRSSHQERIPRAAWDGFTDRPPMTGNHASLKPKDMCLIPFRVALAAQADGWWIRSVVIWNKLNPMPESVKDRPTEGHEYVLLLTKSERYFYDADAVREPYSEQTAWEPYVPRHQKDATGTLAQAPGDTKSRIREKGPNPLGANLRSVWRFSTVGYPGAHFAVFPPELPRRCILAGSPPKVCATCGAPWQRQTQRDVDNTGYPNGPGGNYSTKGRPPGGQERDESSTLGKVARHRVTTLGWQPTCRCDGEPSTKTADCEACQGTGIEQAYPGEGPNTADRNKEPYAGNNPHLLRLEKQPTGELCPECGGTGKTTVEVWSQEVLERWPTRPAIVLDPFAGSGTTLMVAEELGRWWIGIDICEDYLPQIRKRTAQRSLAGAFENATH
jgi:DNA modification methylase